MYGISGFGLMIGLYGKVVKEWVSKRFNLKEGLVNVKVKEIDGWSREELWKKWVREGSKSVKEVS